MKTILTNKIVLLPTITFILLSFIFYLFYGQPRWLLSIPNYFLPEVIYFKETDQPIIALTIDDSPDPKTTPKILEILNKYQVRATFFVITNNIEGNEEIIQQIVNDGHELANHLTEDFPSIKLTDEEFEKQLSSAHKNISEYYQPRWLRPASGWYNKNMINTAHHHGYQVALGSIFPFDTNISSSGWVIQNILFNASFGDIIILHDSHDWGIRTVSTLDLVIPELLHRGYQITTLSELDELSKK